VAPFLLKGGINVKKRLVKTVFVLPTALWILAFTIYPLVYMFYLSFHRFKFGKIRGFVGFDNYQRFFTDEKVINSILVTLTIISIAIVIEIFLGLFLAWLVDRPIRANKFFRVIFSLPLFATPVAAAFLFITIYYEEGGPMNSLLEFFRLSPIPWLSDPFWAKVAVAIVDVWQWTPFCFIVFLAGFQSIPQELYEAAYIDTKSRWKVFRYVSFPLILPVFTIVLILRIMESIKIFDLPAVLTIGGPGRATEVYSFLIYRTGLKYFNIGYASTMGVILLLVEIPLIMFVVKRFRKVIS